MLPPAFLSRMQSQLGDEYESFLSSYQQSPDIGLRVNTLKLTPAQFTSLFPNLLLPFSCQYVDLATVSELLGKRYKNVASQQRIRAGVERFDPHVGRLVGYSSACSDQIIE